MKTRAEIASGASGRLYRPNVVAGLLLGTAMAVLVMIFALLWTGAPIAILAVMGPIPLALCLFALFWLVGTPYAVRWDEQALELTFAFRHDVVEWRDVEFYWKFNTRWSGGGAHVEGETARIGVFLRYRQRSHDQRRRLRWALVGVPGFVPAESFGLLGPPILPGKYTTPFDVYVAAQDRA